MHKVALLRHGESGMANGSFGGRQSCRSEGKSG